MKPEFLDNIEIETDEVLAYLEDDKNSAKSESPGVDDYERFFAAQLSDARNIIHISMAGNTSDGYRHATEAAASFDNVTVVDSCHLSSGMGLLVIYAAGLAKQDMSVEEMVKLINAKSKQIRTGFVVDSTLYLARSGRINSKMDSLCKVLMLHPVISLKKSSMKISRIIMGNRESMKRRYVSGIIRHAKNIDKELVFLTYTGLSEEELDGIITEVRDKLNVKSLICQKALSAISINCGPGSFGIIYLTKG